MSEDFEGLSAAFAALPAYKEVYQNAAVFSSSGVAAAQQGIEGVAGSITR